MTLKQLQSEVAAWSNHNFGEVRWSRNGVETHYAIDPLLGIVEELGELAHSVLKQMQAIRTNEEHHARLRDAVGDLVIYLADFCSRSGLDLEEIVGETWDVVKRRDWRRDPQAGGE